MRKIVLFLILAAIALPSFAMDNVDQPQFAYRFLSEYVQDQEEHGNNKAGAWITIGIGSAAIASSGVLWFWGDELTASMNDGVAWSNDTRNLTCGVLLGTGVATATVGGILLFSNPPDPRARFITIFEAEDSVVQEALAAAALHDLSEEGRRGRLVSGWTQVLSPVITMGAMIAGNLISDNPWYNNLQLGTSQIWSVFNGITTLTLKRSDEEQLYNRYLTARDAYFFVSDDGAGGSDAR